MTVTEQIRKALTQRQDSLYRVAKDSGIAWSTLNRFLSGGGLRSEHVDKLAAYFGLQLTPIKSAKNRKT